MLFFLSFDVAARTIPSDYTERNRQKTENYKKKSLLKMSLGGLSRRYRGESSIVFDMDPEDRHITPLSKQKKNAEFAAKIEREGFPERYAKPAYYGIGSGQRPLKKAGGENKTSHSQLGGGFRCDEVGFDGEYANEFPGRDLRWEHINDDFLGEHRSAMLPYKPKFRPVEGYSQASTVSRSRTPTGKGRADVLGAHKSKVVFAAPGDSFYHDYTQTSTPLTSNLHHPQGPQGEYGKELAADVAYEYSHETPKKAFYQWEYPNFSSLPPKNTSQGFDSQMSPYAHNAHLHTDISPHRHVSGQRVERTTTNNFGWPLDVSPTSHVLSTYGTDEASARRNPRQAEEGNISPAQQYYVKTSKSPSAVRAMGLIPKSPEPAETFEMQKDTPFNTQSPRNARASNSVSTQRQRAQSSTPLRTHRKMVPNPNDHDTNRVLHVFLQDEPKPFRSCVRTGIAPIPELEKDPKTLPKERPSDIFNYRYTGR